MCLDVQSIFFHCLNIFYKLRPACTMSHVFKFIYVNIVKADHPFNIGPSSQTLVDCIGFKIYTEIGCDHTTYCGRIDMV